MDAQTETARAPRLTIVQYAGDFREAAERLNSGGPETYRAQRYSVGYVEALAGRLSAVTTITGLTDAAYDVVLPSGARAIGAGFADRFDGRAVARLVADTNPDLLILRAPDRALMWWAMRNRVRTLMMLANSFNERSLKSRLSRLILKLLLKSSVFDVVANHGARSTRQLLALGVDPAKVYAWDYPALDTPAARPAKSGASAARRIVFVGMLIADKGVDDLVEAARLLRARGVAVTVDLIGKGEEARLADVIAAKDVADTVRIVGPVPNGEIIARMADADVVVVPSRHRYSEGLPLTIYEAYCSRTPLIASDHPMFVGNIVHGESGLVFPAGDAAALADRITQLLDDPALYAALSANGAAAWQRLQIPVIWGDLIDNWIDNGPTARAWLARHRFATLEGLD